MLKLAFVDCVTSSHVYLKKFKGPTNAALGIYFSTQCHFRSGHKVTINQLFCLHHCWLDLLVKQLHRIESVLLKPDGYKQKCW